MGKVSITKRQKQFLLAIYDSLKDEGYPPTFEELRGRFNISSNQAILDHLNALETKGLISRDDTARGIQIEQLGLKTLDVKQIVPLLGKSYAGPLTQAVELQGSWEELSSDVKKLNNDVYIIEISGDSMINAGIQDGDKLLIQSQTHFKSGDIVVAQSPDGTTVKRFIRQNKPPFIYLKPENPKYKHISFTDEVAMQGKIIGKLVSGHWQQLTQGKFL